MDADLVGRPGRVCAGHKSVRSLPYEWAILLDGRGRTCEDNIPEHPPPFFRCTIGWRKRRDPIVLSLKSEPNRSQEVNRYFTVR